MKFIAIVWVENAKTHNMRIEKRIHQGVTFWRYSKVVDLILCMEIKDGGIKDVFLVYLE